MKKTKPKKLLTVLLALCMVLSIVPITAFAVEIDFLPQGVTYLNDFKHTYHTQVNVTANVSVKDSNGAVVETTQVSKSSGEFNFITEGFLSAEVLQTAVGNLQTEIETPYKARGTVTSENESAGPIIDHFESASLYTFTPTSGNPVDFSSDLEAAKQYFNEHPDATGTFTVIRDVHEYQIYDYTYDLTVQENSQPASTITSAVVKNVKFNYQPGDAPQATAEVYNADADKYEIAYECWQEFENNEPVAAWYSDNGSHGSLPTITEFESGKKYVYSLILKPKDGYSFNSETAVTVNGESVKSSLSGEYLYVPAVKTITPTKQNTVITSAAVENVKLDYKDGETPRTTATAATADRDKYDILYECWGKLEKTDEYTTKSVAYWYSDEDYCPSGYADLTSFDKDGKYEYSVRLEAKDGYIFSDSISADDITLNGKSLPEGSFAMTLDDNRTCVVTYGMNMRPGQAVEKIDFNARINFIEGDKPYFLNSAVDPFIDLDHERWDANDGSGYGITSSDYWNERYNGKLITEFEAGKSYTYGVYFKISDLGMEEGYRFDKNTKLYINGEEITLTPDQIDVDDSGETIWFSNVMTITPKAFSGGGYYVPVQKPEIITGEGGKATLENNGTTLVIAPDDGMQISKVTVNGNEVTVTDNKITGLKTGDKVEVTFGKIPPAKEEIDKAFKEKLLNLGLTVRTSKTTKKNVKAVVKETSELKDLIKEIKDAGYTVKYKFYRSTKKSSKYIATVTKTENTYTNTTGKKGTKYYYKARLAVYDTDGNLVAQTELKQCKYGLRTWSK